MISTFSVSVTTVGAMCSEAKNSSIALRVSGPRLEQYERLTREILRRDVFLARQGMLRSGHEQQLFAHDRDTDERRVVHRQRQQAEIGSARAQLANQPRRRSGHQLDVDVRVLLAKGLEQRRKDVQAHCHAADEAQRALDVLLGVEDRGAGLLEVVEHPLAETKERRAGGRDADLATKAQEQLLVELFLQQENLAADSGLRQMQLLSGARERPALRYRPENLELPKIHASVLPVRNRTADAARLVHRQAIGQVIVGGGIGSLQ